MALHISQTSRYILPDNRSHYALLEDAPRERRSRLDQGDGPDGSATDAISQQWAVSDWRRDDSNHGVLRTGGADIAFLEIGMPMLLPLTDFRWRVPLLGLAPTLSSSTMTGRWL